MLQRAASNAYSWWWASHIRTKQSKWLEQNLQDIEEKVQYVLKLLEEDGDSFAKRAEMYYKRRPELIEFVEELYRAYRALAERYDHLSTELQNANTTIASVFPDRVPQFAIDDDYYTDSAASKFANRPKPDMSKANIPSVPKLPVKDFRGVVNKATKRLQPRKSMKIKGVPLPAAKSGLSKPEAVKEIDKLQKEILTLQTEKEFVKSSYEDGLEKYWEIEKHITEKQERIVSLQDEFGEGIAIEDDEARKLMAETAIRSCQERLIQLQEKQKRSIEEAKIEHERIKESREKLKSLTRQLLGSETVHENEFTCDGTAGSDEAMTEEEMQKAMEKKKELESLREKMKEQLDAGANTSISISEMAERIDELVNTVIGLETAVSSQMALIQRLRTETNELQSQMQTVKDDKANVIDDENNLRSKLREMEEKLKSLQDLDRNVEDQRDNFQTHFTEASCNLDHLSENLSHVKPYEENETVAASNPPEEPIASAELERRSEEQEQVAGTSDGSEKYPSDKAEKEHPPSIIKFKNEERKSAETEVAIAPGDQSVDSSRSKPSAGPDGNLEKQAQEADQNSILINGSINIPENPSSCKNANRSHHSEQQGQEAVKEDEPDWKELFTNGMQDREKHLLSEYTTALRSYKEVKRKLGETQQKLENANATKDEELQSLRQRLSLLERSLGVSAKAESTRSRDEEGDIGMVTIDQNHTMSPVEERFRASMDELLEENLDFWMRFSHAFGQIQKFDASTEDLKSEITKLEKKKMQEGSSTTRYALRSEVRPLYKHLKEIRSEVRLWTEKGAELKEELKSRFESLCNIQDEITNALKASAEDDEFEFTSYQAAKFQGEILNMKQENHKVADELQAGLDYVTMLQLDLDKTLAKLRDEFVLSGSKSDPQSEVEHSDSRTRVPLRSFIFGSRAKRGKQSIFSCVHPSLYRKIRATS